MSSTDIPDLARQSALLMRARLGASGETLEQTLRHRGRRLPRKIRRAAEQLARAESMAGHPRLRVLLDNAQVERSGRLLLNHLRPLGAAERRWRLFLSIAASMSFAFLVTVAGVVAVLIWRGYL
jgi:ribose 1,5-bisphosphokinase PhnN